MNKTVRELLNDEEVSFEEFRSLLEDNDIGFWDSVNSTGTIRDYIKEQIDEGISVSHMLEAIETNESIYDLWEVWLGNSMETPSPIDTKEDLINALSLDDEDLEQIIEK